MVCHGNHSNTIGFDNIQQAVRKTLEWLSSNFLSDKLVRLRIGSNLLDRSFKFYQKRKPQSRGSRFIITDRFGDLSVSFAMEGDCFHEIADRARRKTSSDGIS